ncbi:uncharacterized protein LOC144168103 [Haemaphysalis longicornis]
MCGDVKITINPVAAAEEYPRPRSKDLWSALSRGQKFTKRELRNAYQQLVLQKSSWNGQYLGHIISQAARPRHPAKFDGVPCTAVRLEKGIYVALQRSKELTTKAQVLVHFDPAKPVVVTAEQRYSQLDTLEFRMECFHQARGGHEPQAAAGVIPQRLLSRVVQLLYAGHAGGPFMGHYFVVVVYAFLKWVEVLPVPTPSAGATIEALRQVFTAQLLPDVLVYDNGTAFASEEYLAWLTKNGSRRVMVPPYQSASNRAAERVIQIVKDKLKKSKAADFWTHFAQDLFQYRTTPQDIRGRAPCNLLLRRMVKTPLDVLPPDQRSTALLKQLKQKMAADRDCHTGPLPESGAPVFAGNFRPCPPWSAGHVVSPASASPLLVRMSGGTTRPRQRTM